MSDVTATNNDGGKARQGVKANHLQWFYHAYDAQGGRACGPLRLAEIREAYHRGNLKDDDLVWHTSNKEPMVALKDSALFGYVKEGKAAEEIMVGMHDTLSSSATFYYKMLPPALWIAGFGLGTLAVWVGDVDQPSPDSMRFHFLVAWIIGSAFFLRDTVRLKTVVLDKDDLVIRNFTRVIRVPLRNINHIRESRFISPKTISLALYPPSAFGDKIRFIPKLAFRISLKLLSEHPIVTRLRELTGVLK